MKKIDCTDWLDDEVDEFLAEYGKLVVVVVHEADLAKVVAEEFVSSRDARGAPVPAGS